MRRLLWVFVALALVAAACGGGGSADSAESETSEVEAADQRAAGNEADPETEAAVAALVEEFGGTGAFAAAMFAIERGYGIEQLIDGAVAGLVQKDGTLDGIEPEGPALELIIIDTNSPMFVSYSSGPIEIEKISVEEFYEIWVTQMPGDGIATGQEERGALGVAGLLAALADGDKIDGFREDAYVLSVVMRIGYEEAADLARNRDTATYEESEASARDQGLDKEPDESGDEAAAEPKPRKFRGEGSITYIYEEQVLEKKLYCDITVPLDVDLALNPDDKAVLGFSDWAISGVQPGEEPKCSAMGEPRIYEGTWSSEGSVGQALIDVAGIGQVSVDFEDGVASGESNITDGLRRIIINFTIPEVQS